MNPDTDPDYDLVLDDLRRMTQDSHPVAIAAQPFTWWCVASAIQLAARHPDLTDPLRSLVVDFANQIAGHIVTTPELRAFFVRGWDPNEDSETFPTDR